MKGILLKFRKNKIVICSLLVCVLFLSNVGHVSAAADHTIHLNFSKGGSWTYTGIDSTATAGWSDLDWRNITLVKKINFLTPAQVQAQANALGQSSGISGMLSPVKYMIEAAVTGGVEYAKKQATIKFGAALVTKLTPFLSAFSWTYTAYDILTDMVDGYEQYTISTAATLGKGLIWQQVQTSGGTMAVYSYWDGSTAYGAYPQAKLGPNNYQFGDYKIFN